MKETFKMNSDEKKENELYLKKLKNKALIAGWDGRDEKALNETDAEEAFKALQARYAKKYKVKIKKR